MFVFLSLLLQAVSRGYSDVDWMQQDEDLECLRTLPQFIALCEQLKAKKQA